MEYIFINSQPYLSTKPSWINFHSIQAWTGWGKVEQNKNLDIVQQT